MAPGPHFVCIPKSGCDFDPFWKTLFNFDKDESIVEIDSEVNMLESHVILNLPLSAKTVADYTRKDPMMALATLRYKCVANHVAT